MSVPILIRDDVAWLPIPLDRLDYLELNSPEALGWMLEGFIARAKRQHYGAWDPREPDPSEYAD